MNWLMNNMGNIVVSFLLFALIVVISMKLIKDKKQGKSSCGCNCAHCAMAGKCHKNAQKQAPSFKV